MFSLRLFESLRFCDLRGVGYFRLADTAARGRPINKKDKTGDLMARACPLSDSSCEASWAERIYCFLGKLAKKSPTSEFLYLPPNVDNNWAPEGQVATFGIGNAASGRLLEALGVTTKVNLHPFWSWVPTCANQLKFGREKRTTLGRQRSGGAMPDLYGRATCAAELAHRDSSTHTFRDGRRPVASFGVPRTSNELVGRGAASSVVSATCDTESNTAMRLRRPDPKIDELIICVRITELSRGG